MERHESLYIMFCGTIFVGLYLILAWTAKLFFMSRGLKIKYINHAPWPWRAFWNNYVDIFIKK